MMSFCNFFMGRPSYLQSMENAVSIMVSLSWCMNRVQYSNHGTVTYECSVDCTRLVHSWHRHIRRILHTQITTYTAVPAILRL